MPFNNNEFILISHIFSFHSYNFINVQNTVVIGLFYSMLIIRLDMTIKLYLVLFTSNIIFIICHILHTRTSFMTLLSKHSCVHIVRACTIIIIHLVLCLHTEPKQQIMKTPNMDVLYMAQYHYIKCLTHKDALQFLAFLVTLTVYIFTSNYST